MAEQPTMDTSLPPYDTDTTGRKWLQAMLAADGKILAGRDELGNFHCYVDSETLFDSAISTFMHLQGTTD